eukprot:scaffold1465_cov383-Prasinococcus_capsulatus_cf.AAC.1
MMRGVKAVTHFNKFLAPLLHEDASRVVDRLLGRWFYISYWSFVVFESFLADFRLLAPRRGCTILGAREFGLAGVGFEPELVCNYLRDSNQASSGILAVNVSAVALPRHSSPT